MTDGTKNQGTGNPVGVGGAGQPPNGLAASIDTDAKAIMFAHSKAATDADPKKDAIFKCIVAAFDNQGLKHISSMADMIVWSTIPNAVVNQLGLLIRECVTQNVSDPGGLVAMFRVLKDHNRVMSVSDLVNAIEEIL